MLKYYHLIDDVYVVNGKKRSCIYDLRKGQLYSISQAVSSFIDRIRSSPIKIESLSDEEASYINYLLSSGLIEDCSFPHPANNIDSLKKNYQTQFSWIEVTRQCNLSCSFCYEGSNPYCTERMSWNDFKLVVDNLKEYGVGRIQFIGGEPLILKNELKAMISLARKDFSFIEVYTNGIMIDENWCDFFKMHNIHVALSIHSYIAEEHDKLTQVEGSHRKVERALDLIKKAQIPYRIGTVCSKTCKVGAPTNEQSYKLNPKLPKVTGRSDFEDFDLEMFKKKAITKASKTYPLDKNKISIAVSGHQCFIKDIYISSLLEVFPCVMERRISHGNLRVSRLRDIIKHEIRHLSKDHVEGCKDCEYRYGCFDCRPDSNGRGLYSKPWFCTYDPTKGEWHEAEEVYEHLKGKQKLQSISVKIE